jgi:hypothetical protein
MHKNYPAKHNSRHLSIPDTLKNPLLTSQVRICKYLLTRFVRKWTKAKAKLCGCDDDLSKSKKTTA